MWVAGEHMVQDWAREVKSRNNMVKSAFSKKKILITKRLDLKGRN
jgi:hypothetical protein